MVLMKIEHEVIDNVFEYIFDDKNKGKMVISHTPQFIYNMNINKSCNGKIWRLDTGMSRGFDEHHILIEKMLEKTGLRVINQLKSLINQDSYRYISILEIKKDCEKIITEYKFSRDYIHNKRIEHSEAVMTEYRLSELINNINNNKIKLNQDIKDQKEKIIEELENMIIFLKNKHSIHIKNEDHNVCLVDYN